MNKLLSHKKPSAIRSANIDIEDQIDDEFEVDFIERNAGTFRIWLDNVIKSPSQFRKAVRALEAADDNHDVVMMVQGPGGDLGATDLLLHAMRKCQGHIHAIGSGNCSSAMTLILLAADSVELTEGWSGMFHCGSVGHGGAFNEYEAQARFNMNYMNRVLRTQYAGFMSEEELDDMMKGVDRWMEAPEFIERWNRRNELFDEMVQEAIADASEDACPDCGNEECSCEPHEAVGATD